MQRQTTTWQTQLQQKWHTIANTGTSHLPELDYTLIWEYADHLFNGQVWGALELPNGTWLMDCDDAHPIPCFMEQRGEHFLYLDIPQVKALIRDKGYAMLHDYFLHILAQGTGTSYTDLAQQFPYGR